MQVDSSVGGKYSCEVSADAPSFHTALVTGETNVVGKCQLNIRSNDSNVNIYRKFKITLFLSILFTILFFYKIVLIT